MPDFKVLNKKGPFYILRYLLKTHHKNLVNLDMFSFEIWRIWLISL
jgi:hypothetical protein